MVRPSVFLVPSRYQLLPTGELCKRKQKLKTKLQKEEEAPRWDFTPEANISENIGCSAVT